MTERYLEPHQARTRDNTPFEDLLADSIERAFAEQIHDLPSLVAFLNISGPPCPNAEGLWTEASYKTLMSKLGE